MKKLLKHLLLALAALAALLLALVVYIAATFEPNAYKPQLVQRVKEETGRTLTIPGEIGLTFFPRLGAQLGRFSLSEPGSEQVFASATQVRVAVALLPLLSRQVVVDRVLVDGLNLRLHRDRGGRFNFDDLLPKDTGNAAAGPAPAAAPKAPAALPRLDIGGIALTHASLDFHDEAQQRQLRISNLNFTTGPIASDRKSTLEFSADLAADQPRLALHLALKTGFTFDPARQQARFEQLAASIKGAAAGVRDLQFKLTLPSATASAQALQAPALALELSAPHPGGGMLALQVQGQASADLAREAVQLALDGRLDATTLALRAGLNNFARPSIDFDLALGELDADRYLPRNATAAPPGPAAAANPEADVDLAPLRALDARGSLKVATLKIMNLRAANLRLGLKLQDGQAELNPLTATLYGGGVHGALSAGAGQPQRLAARLDLRGIQLGPLLQDLLDQQPIDGRGNVAVNVSATGRTASQLKRSLDGTVGLQLRDGAINGINLAAALREARAALSGSPRLGQAQAHEKTDFTELSASFKIRQGVAHNDDLAAKTPLLRLGGAGDIHIAEDRLDYTVKATVVPSLQGQGGPELDQLGGLTIPVRLSGPYAAIGWKIDLGGLATRRAREQADQRKAQLQQELRTKLDKEKAKAQQRLKEQAEERMRNLLRR